MSAVMQGVGTNPSAPIRAWGLLAVGALAVLLPSYWSAAQGLWQSEESGHGPIILAILGWLFWKQREAILAMPARSSQALGWPLFAVGVGSYVLGRMFSISSVEFFSHLLLALSVVLLLKGLAGARALWFPLLYMIFMVPLPGTLVDAMTGPLKSWISVIVVEFLHGVGYPIARHGVTITIGQYQLLVADACSGLHSMFSLAALGALFTYLMARRRVAHNLLLILSILPIAFAANILRVVILVLVTYHFGDEAGQGFLHGAAGIVLMLVALALFIALDGLLARVLPVRSTPAAQV